MGIIDLTSNLAIGAGINLSDHGRRHGGITNTTPSLPAHPATHTSYDDGVGNSTNAQSFTVGSGYVVTGNKTWDRPNASALAQMLE